MFAFARVVGVVRRQDIAGREIGGVQIENVRRELPPQRHEAGQFGPCAVGDEERVVADVERRRGAEFSPPLSDGAHVLEVLIQHVRDHAQHFGKVAGDEIVVAADGLIFEVDDNDLSRSGHSLQRLLRPDQAQQAGVVFAA